MRLRVHFFILARIASFVKYLLDHMSLFRQLGYGIYKEIFCERLH